MLSRVVIIFLFLSMMSTKANSECVFCDSIIVLNNRLGECFRSEYENNLKAMSSTDKPFMLVDLSICAGRKDTKKGPMVLDLNDRLKTAFVMDKASLQCLRGLLDKAGNLDPSREFDLVKDCGK